MESVKRIKRFPSGVMTPPASKSYSHRAVICAALAAICGTEGESRIENLGRSEDIDATLAGVRALGAGFSMEGDTLRVLPGTARKTQIIDCGESGSTLRFLLPVAALRKDEIAFTGRGRLLQRPLDAYRDVFGQAGVAFSQDSAGARVKGPLKGGRYELPGDVSSQFVSGLLLVLPLAEEDSELWLTTPLESADYVEMTLAMMRHYGVEVLREGTRYLIRGGQRYVPAHYTVEPDYSQAAFFLAAGALGRDVVCAGLNPESLQGDRAILRILREMDAEVSAAGDFVKARADGLRAVTVDARQIPDLVPPVAALCCFCEGTSRIVNAGRLRLKESDRLTALTGELRALGAEIAEEVDSLVIRGRRELPGGRADARGDHRIAMAIAVAAIRCSGPVELTGWESVGKSYPGFWNDFEREGRV